MKQIDVNAALSLMQARQAQLFDIRDSASFKAAHPQGAQHLSNANLAQCLQALEYETPIIVICYHGISSQGVVSYLSELGFDEVYNLQGGFERWLEQAPAQSIERSE